MQIYMYICMTCIQSNGNVLKCKWGDHLAVVVDESYIIRVNKEDSDQRRAHYSS